MSSWLGNILGRSAPSTSIKEDDASRTISSSTSAQGRMAGTSVERVSSGDLSFLRDVPDKFNLENLSDDIGHFQITNVTEGQLVFDEVSSDQKPTSLQKVYRAMTRDAEQREIYRRGIDQVRTLLLKKYDQSAVDRFDKHFSYRMWAGKPLTVRALKAFMEQEDVLREGGVNISTLGATAKNLEELKEGLPTEHEKRDYRIIGGGKVPSAPKTDYSFPILPIKRSWFETAANTEDLKKGREAGVEEAKKAILDLIPNETTKKHVEHLFNCHFATKIEKKEILTVEQLSGFIDDAIKMRNNENKMLGGFYSAITTAKNAGEDIVNAAIKFFQEAYHEAGIVAGAAVVANAEAGVNDPITALAKVIAAGTLIAAENDTERIGTALMEHFVATPAATPQTSITSRVLKFFTFGIY